MNTPFAVWVESFPSHDITTATIETIGYKHMYFNFLETDSALDPTDSPEPSMTFEDFCEAVEDLAMINATEKAVETLAGLPLAMLIAALDAGEAVNEIDDELDEDDIIALAEHFRIDGPTIEAASIILKAGQAARFLSGEVGADEVIQRHAQHRATMPNPGAHKH
ncbi:hypothetical protein [Caballeronia zhejiangensis]|uniref:hypothetical protein n=1 Tax=Caballeronia zhejiangensis TaxID=871203 RepID=UPI001F51A481|nr:hypothetical protein [Caballeronia zhejiangensis]MCI1041777.1 hypothetical protein [Caballeronia zhejiangensis]